ncbi:hypothetical protein TNCV_4506291 [Trichonephila clavipes]|nr:hypothetical protein TNCV_4506291 [Trichonephila clavipes]
MCGHNPSGVRHELLKEAEFLMRTRDPTFRFLAPASIWFRQRGVEVGQLPARTATRASFSTSSDETIDNEYSNIFLAL